MSPLNTPDQRHPDQEEVLNALRTYSRSLQTSQPDTLAPLAAAAKGARFVLLGEASHGTSEFYRMRAELTKQLVREGRCRFIAVEGDWPACFAVNRYIQGLPDAEETAEAALGAFDRWPEWMWANHEIRELVEWLREHNLGLSREEQIGFYGIDVYSLWESMDEIVAYLEETGSEHVEAARAAFACFEPFGREGQSYGISAALFGEGCEEEVVSLLAKLRTERMRSQDPQEAGIDAEINGLVTLHAEQYYRAMITDNAESWNIRDRHMTEVLQRLSAFYGSCAQGIVWEHNTHIGDARATDMAAAGMVNVGQLLRESCGPGEVFAIGFGTHRGTVMAAYAWGDTPEVMQVPPGVPGSWEALLHEAVGTDCYLLLGETSEALRGTIPHRAIGVVYHPQHERGNYVPTRITERYDAFVHIEESRAVSPLIPLPALA